VLGGQRWSEGTKKIPEGTCLPPPTFRAYELQISPVLSYPKSLSYAKYPIRMNSAVHDGHEVS